MINLSWDTNGRIDRETYRKERWRHFAFCLIPIALFVLGGIGAMTAPIWLCAIAWIAGFVLITYYRYRFMQVMVRRLHDRNLSGWFMLLSPLVTVLAMAVGGGWLFATFAVGAPVRLDETTSQGVFFAILLPTIIINIFLRFQLTRPGTNGPNKYGLPPGVGQAQIF
ncbi:MAG: DUF805 domain-containing protein [Asticcacaulis sp.]|uniref:DUF805 domain-containing protein n=1 Tax=Asticcacaulis sp. TaxID=1872648 RepID=UPI003F7BF86D